MRTIHMVFSFPLINHSKILFYQTLYKTYKTPKHYSSNIHQLTSHPFTQVFISQAKGRWDLLRSPERLQPQQGGFQLLWQRNLPGHGSQRMCQVIDGTCKCIHVCQKENLLIPFFMCFYVDHGFEKPLTVKHSTHIPSAIWQRLLERCCTPAWIQIIPRGRHGKEPMMPTSASALHRTTTETNGLQVVRPVCRETEAVAMPWLKPKRSPHRPDRVRRDCRRIIHSFNCHKVS